MNTPLLQIYGNGFSKFECKMTQFIWNREPEMEKAMILCFLFDN